MHARLACFIKLRHTGSMHIRCTLFSKNESLDMSLVPHSCKCRLPVLQNISSFSSYDSFDRTNYVVRNVYFTRLIAFDLYTYRIIDNIVVPTIFELFISQIDRLRFSVISQFPKNERLIFGFQDRLSQQDDRNNGKIYGKFEKRYWQTMSSLDSESLRIYEKFESEKL